MNGIQNINIDAKTLDACLKQIENFGGTIYRNICTGNESFVRWGQMDWFVYILSFSIIIAVIAATIWLIKNI